MSDELVFYTNPMSRGRVIRWMLEELAVEYRTEVLEYGTTMKDPSYLKINPMGKVPTIVHRGKVVTECAAICAYLADAFPEKGLAPALGERADYYRWLFFTAGPLEAAITDRNLGVTYPPEKERMVGYGNYDHVVSTLANSLEDRTYVCGDKFTAADVYVGSQVGWGLQFGTLPKEASFERYWNRLRDRPALASALKKDGVE